jgi:hypothetical protein
MALYNQSASADSLSATSFQLVVGVFRKNQFQPALGGLLDQGFNPLFQGDLRPMIHGGGRMLLIASQD